MLYTEGPFVSVFLCVFLCLFVYVRVRYVRVCLTFWVLTTACYWCATATGWCFVPN